MEIAHRESSKRETSRDMAWIQQILCEPNFAASQKMPVDQIAYLWG